mgnify:FL=1
MLNMSTEADLRSKLAGLKGYASGGGDAIKLLNEAIMTIAKSVDQLD